MIGIPRDIDKALAHLNLQSGMHVVQFGAQRRGHIAYTLAEIVGQNGKVTLVDVLAEELQAVKTFFAGKGIFWVNAVRGDFATDRGVPLEQGVADCVVIAHTAWRNPSHNTVLGEARRLLKPGGKILFLDWQKDTPDPLGSRVNGHLDILEAQRLCLQSGCERVERVVNNTKHWGFVLNFPKK